MTDETPTSTESPELHEWKRLRRAYWSGASLYLEPETPPQLPEEPLLLREARDPRRWTHLAIHARRVSEKYPEGDIRAYVTKHAAEELAAHVTKHAAEELAEAAHRSHAGRDWLVQIVHIQELEE